MSRRGKWHSPYAARIHSRVSAGMETFGLGSEAPSLDEAERGLYTSNALVNEKRHLVHLLCENNFQRIYR